MPNLEDNKKIFFIFFVDKKNFLYYTIGRHEKQEVL